MDRLAPAALMDRLAPAALMDRLAPVALMDHWELVVLMDHWALADRMVRLELDRPTSIQTNLSCRPRGIVSARPFVFMLAL
jgi:hypothetical protein